MITALFNVPSALKRVLLAPWRKYSPSAPSNEWSGRAARRSLMLKAMGNEALANRLIAYELRRAPGISWGEAVTRANARWERDLAR
jgi:hypothetical protein